MVYSASGTRVGVYFQFTVNASSTAVLDVTMSATNNSSISNGFVGPFTKFPTLAITNSSFSFQGDAGECNGNRGSYSFKATFRSTTSADGEWKDTNSGPPGYIFCGSESFNWTATKTAGGSGGGTPLSTPGIAISLVPAPGTISIGRCGTSDPPMCTLAATVTVQVVSERLVQFPYVEMDLLQANGQRCASFATTLMSGRPTADPIQPNIRAVYATSFLSFDRAAGSQTPLCLPPFTTTKARARLHDLAPSQPIIYEQTIDHAYDWTK